MNEMIQKIRQELLEMQDLEYRDFHAKLMPTVDKEYIIGVRVPVLRKYAKKLAKEPQIGEFLEELPHQYYEENNVHAFVIEQTKDFEKCLEQVELFLPYIDNWATCDMLSPKVFGKHTEELVEVIKKWLDSEKTYTLRFGIGMLMRFYLDENYDDAYPAMVAHVKSEEYYVNMMIAWYFATALAKQYEAVLPYLTEYKLEPWIHNKTIQKACESYRISKEQKEFLRTLRIKN